MLFINLKLPSLSRSIFYLQSLKFWYLYLLWFLHNAREKKATPLIFSFHDFVMSLSTNAKGIGHLQNAKYSMWILRMSVKRRCQACTAAGGDHIGY